MFSISENLRKQDEEIEALRSIYDTDFSIWSAEGESTRTYKIRVEEHKQEAILYVSMPPEYPSQSPPKFEISAPWMDRKSKAKLHQALNEIYLEHIAETVIYQWVEKVRELVQSLKPAKKGKKTQSNKTETAHNLSECDVRCPEIIHGEVIIDRKSIFQGHAAVVHSVEEVRAVLEKLKRNKKIMHAKHNMFVYRIERKTGRGTTSMLQDCDEDGEAHAGGRMMKLIEILDQKNTLVVVTRWYGGIQLGPDRFRHINNAMRQVIEQAGLLKK